MGRPSPSKQNNYGKKPGVPNIPKVQIPTGGRSTVKRAEREAAVKRSQNPYVPPAPTASSSTRQGGRARVTGGIQIGVPQSSPISTQRPNRSSSTTTAIPTQNPERPTTPGNGGRIYGALPATVNQNLGAYDSSVTLPGMTRGLPSDYKETELAAGQTAENHRAGAGFGGQTRVSPTGVVQKGTQTSPAPMTMKQANSLLTGGYEVQDPYSSNQLPTTKSSPYGNVGPVVDGDAYAKMVESQKPGAVTGVGPIASGEQYAKNVEAGEQLAVKPTDTATNWGARTAADNSDPNMARRRAFLDAEGSMQGLRRAEATQGIVYAGGQHHIVNPNKGQEGENDFVSIGDKDDVRGYKSGRLSAQDMKDKYVTKIKDNGITSYDEDKVSTTAGPLADADAYGQHLQTQQSKYKTTGIGPLADGALYAKLQGK